MSTQEIRVPDLGGADEVEVVEVLVSKGDQVEAEDSLVTVESDKATVELPAPAAGTIVSLSVKVGDRLKEGDLVGEYEPADEADGDTGDDESARQDEEPPASGEGPEEPEEKTDGDEGSDDKSEEKEGDAPAAASKGASRKKLVKVPALDGFEDVPVIEINVSEGDAVSAEDPLVTVESDKATLEIPSPHTGKVLKILVSEGDALSEGDDLLEMEVEEAGGESDRDEAEEEERKPDSGTSRGPEASSKESEEPREEPEAASQQERQSHETAAPAPGTKVHAGPAVRKLARELGADLLRVKPSGPKNRILKDDVEGYIRQKMKQVQEGGSVEGAGIPPVKLPDFTRFGEVKREAMTRVHIVTAESMQRSWLNIPHVTQFDEAEITELEAFRKSQRAAGEEKGVKLTLLPFLLKASAAVLAELPQFNVSLDMERKEVIRKQYIHIGIAVDTPAGLMVPVIRDVDKKGLWQLAEEAAELAAKARDRKLKPADMQGACFTVTSLGGIGGTAFTPIVTATEVAILGVSRAQMKPVWNGEAFDPGLMLPLSLSYDHRAVNGADAARFTDRLSVLLGDIRQLLL